MDTLQQERMPRGVVRETEPQLNDATPLDPKQEYVNRLASLRATGERDGRTDRTLGAAKLALVLVGAVLAVWLAKYHVGALAWLLVPAVLFVVLAAAHERVLRRLRYGRRVIALYEAGLARVENRWVSLEKTGQGKTAQAETGERFLDPAHPYARDLDIFGVGSLFQLLCTAHTRAGEETLAAWLMAPAAPAEVRLRQAAVAELRDRLKFREALATAGEDARVGLHPEALVAWSKGEGVLDGRRLRTPAFFFAALWVASLVCWAVWGLGSVALAMSLVNLAITYKFRLRVQAAAGGVEGAAHDLQLLVGVLSAIEGQSFRTEKLVNLQAALRSEGVRPSEAIARLERIESWLSSNDNWFVKVLDPFVFWTAQCVFSAERWRGQHGRAVRDWVASVGEVEALTALAGYSFEHPADVFPELLGPELLEPAGVSGPVLELLGFAHPLIPVERAVANDLQLGEQQGTGSRNEGVANGPGLRLMVISGPNMAGKSTFIRAVGVNAVLAQCGAPVRARAMRMTPLAVTASICILDSLQGGLSRFYAEIRRLKQIADLSQGERPVLFLLDELLSGTNSHDRRVGTESVVKSLVEHGAIGLVTTHDLALAKIAEGMGERAANFHFGDTFENGELHFEYRLSPGVVESTNALALMRSIGLGV